MKVFLRRARDWFSPTIPVTILNLQESNPGVLPPLKRKKPPSLDEGFSAESEGFEPPNL